ncbi:phage tail tape measure protein [Paenibacillus azoreducens]|uniref:phage tail tape measure protein n=1 Tax=Paenibacillus azoreducens TaxID=116718 RepID=UPI0039F5BF63
MSDEMEVANLVTKISIDDTGVERSMAELTRQMKIVETEFQAASTKLGEHADAQEALRVKSDALNKQMEIQAQKIAKLKQQHQEAVTAKGADARETQNLEAKLHKAVSEYNKMHNQLKTTTEELNKQTSAWEKAAAQLDAVGKKMESLAKQMTQAGQSLSLMVTGPLAAIGGYATKASIDYETAFANVKKYMSGTEEEFEKLSNSIRDMAKESPFAATEISKVAASATQLGIKKENILSFSKAMLDIGVSSNLAADDAAIALARFSNITQMPQENFERLGSTIVGLGNNFAAMESEMAEFGMRIAGAGHQVGMSEAEIMSFSAALAAVGIEAEAGGTAFSKLMINMASEIEMNGKKLKDFAAVAGMSVDQFRKSFKEDAAGTITTFIEGLGRISAAGGNTFGVIDKLGLSEIRLRDALLRAAGAGDLFSQALKVGTKAWDENTELAKTSGTFYETTANQMKVLGNRIKDSAITLGDALVPALMAALDAIDPLFKAVEKGAEWFSKLDAESQKTIITIAAMAAAAGPLLIIAGKLVTSIAALIPVVKGLGTALMFLVTNPIGLVLTGIAAAATAFMAIKSSMDEARQATEELAQAQERLQEVQQNGITRDEVQATQEKIDKLNELISTYQKLIDIASASSAAQMGNNVGALYSAADELGVKLEDVSKTAAEFGIELKFIDENGKITAKSMKDLQSAVNVYSKAVKDAKRETAAEISEKAKAIAIKNQEALSTENLLKRYTSAKQGSKEWSAAQRELINQFPQFASATGVNTEAIKGLVLVKKQEIEKEWQAIQVKAQEALQEKRTAIAKQEAAISIAKSIAQITGAGGLAEIALAKMNAQLDILRGEAASLGALVNMKPDDFKLPPPPKVPVINLDDEEKKKKGKKEKKPKKEAYENKALDDAYRKLEHLKAMDELTSEQELKMLETIKAKYVKTAEERMTVEEKIHAVKKQLGEKSLENALKDYERSKQLGKLTEDDEIARLQRIKKLYATTAEQRADLDDKIFEASQRKIEADKQRRAEAVQYTNKQLQAAYEDRLAREKLSDEESFKLKDKLYNEQIYVNKDYLKKVLADDKYTAAEKKKLEREITEEIRKQTNDRLILQRDYAEQVRKQQIDSINNMARSIQDALKAKYSSEKQAAEEALKESQNTNEKWKNNELDAIKSVYNARVEAAQKAADAEVERINAVYNARIDAIQRELDALDQAEKQRSRAELDAEDEKKISRLKDKIEYEHDEYNKKQLQEELNKVTADMNERHRQEQLQDKKDALKAEQQVLKDRLAQETQAVKDQLAQKKEIMQQEYEAQQANINAIYTAQKTSLDQQLLDKQNHYSKLLEAKNLQAEAEKMIINQQQQDILVLLNEFGDGYKDAGTTLGQHLVDGFKPKVDEISRMIADVIAQINAASAAALQMKAQAAAAAPPPSVKETMAGSGSGSKGKVFETTGIIVQNTFNTPVTSPSDVSRATTKAAQQLARL